MDNQTIRVSPILAPIVSLSIRENKMGEGKRQGRDGKEDKLRKKMILRRCRLERAQYKQQGDIM